MKRMKIHENVRISRVLSDGGTKCVHCNLIMPRNTVALSITKPLISGNPMTMWIHIHCVDDFHNTLRKGIDEHAKDIVVETL